MFSLGKGVVRSPEIGLYSPVSINQSLRLYLLPILLLLPLSSCGKDAEEKAAKVDPTAKPTVAEPKVAEPKAETPKVAEPKAADPEAAEFKAETPEEKKVVLFFELLSESNEAGVKKACEKTFKTQAEGGVAMIRSAVAKPWEPVLATAGLSHKELIAFASANPAFARHQLKLSEKRQVAFLESMKESCFDPMSKLPPGDMDAADAEMMKILTTTGRDRPGPLDGVDLEVQHWGSNLEEGLALAAKTEVPVLLFFDASWCAPCEVIGELFQSQVLVDTVGEKFVRISIDVSEDTEALSAIQKRYEALALPALLMLDQKGIEIGRYTAKAPTEESLIEFLLSEKK